MEQTDRPILIAQIEPPQADTTGDYYYRTYAPGLAMSQQYNVYFIGLTSLHRNIRKLMNVADIVVLKNICDINLVPLIHERKRYYYDHPVVYELADDMFNIPPWNPVHSFYQNIENRQIMKKTIEYCNGLQFPSKQLNMLYGHLRSHCAVFQNQITIIPPDRPSQNGKGTLDIGWGGSHGHLEDMKAIQASLSEWLRKTKNARLHLMCSDTIWNLFDNVPSGKKIRYKPGTIYDYYDFLKNIDIGIAPLADTPFNRSRSDVKFLEYAVNEAVAVVQDMVTYRDTVQHGKTGYLFKNEYDLVSILDALAGDPELRTNIGKAARQYVIKERLQYDHVEERIDYYCKQIAHLRTLIYDKKDFEYVEKQFDEFASLPNAKLQGRHLILEFGEYETLMHNGLVELQANNNRGKAHSMFLEAAAIAPEEYLPCLMAFSCFPESKDSLMLLYDACERNPNAISAFIGLGENLANKGEFVTALEFFQKAISIFPDYDIPYRRLATVFNKLGYVNEAKSFERIAASKMVDNC